RRHSTPSSWLPCKWPQTRHACTCTLNHLLCNGHWATMWDSSRLSDLASSPCCLGVLIFVYKYVGFTCTDPPSSHLYRLTQIVLFDTYCMSCSARDRINEHL